MSPLKRSNNIAARMGRWSASHWKTAVFGWLAFVIASLVVGMQVGTKQLSNDDANVGQAHGRGLKRERKEGICRNEPLTFCRNDKLKSAKCLILWWAHKDSNLGPAD